MFNPFSKTWWLEHEIIGAVDSWIDGTDLSDPTKAWLKGGANATIISIVVTGVSRGVDGHFHPIPLVLMWLGLLWRDLASSPMPREVWSDAERELKKALKSDAAQKVGGWFGRGK